jgi:hypothetical protein
VVFPGSTSVSRPGPWCCLPARPPWCSSARQFTATLKYLMKIPHFYLC